MPRPTPTQSTRRSALMTLGCVFLFALSGGAQTMETNLVPVSTTAVAATAPDLPNAALSLFRVLGALALVIALFLVGVWLYRNWQRLVLQKGRTPKLNVLEVRALGGRHAIYVVGYERERFLLSSSPTGMNLLSHLPPAEAEPAEQRTAAQAEAAPTRLSFAQVFQQVLKGQ